MNNQRREKLRNINRKLEEINSELNAVKDDEEWAFESMPENLQSSMRGEDSQEYISIMEDAIDHIEQALEQMGELDT